MTVDKETLDLLADYECEMCGPFVDDEGNTTLTQQEADEVICGDLETGERTCPECESEVSQTLESLLDYAKMVAERLPHLGPKIAESFEQAAKEAEDG